MTNELKSGRCRETEPAIPNPIPFPDEISHLTMINRKLDEALQDADLNVDRIDKEYMDAKRYMAEYRGEIDPNEMFQNELSLKQIDHTGAIAAGNWERLYRLKESPYFARIDFAGDGTETDCYYIGPSTFSFQNELLIFDWRAPISSMFYDYEAGPAGYDSPMGRIEGNLTRKRQFKIKNRILDYVLESSVNIQDDVLQRELSHTSDKKMKSIISTIQKEQSRIIRNEKTGTMIIQGVAGSGKTSIALHRIAFLLYRFKDRLNAKNITILSPNKVFGNYISTVLPELGEEPIFELSFRDIAEMQLENVIRFEPDQDPLETDDEEWAERIRFKSTLDFVKKMDQYMDKMPALIFDSGDYDFGQKTVSSDWIQARFCAYQSDPVKIRLAKTADDIHELLKTECIMDSEIPRPGVILKSLNKMLKIKNSLSLYRHFYQWLKRPELLVLPEKQTLEWADVYPFLYLHGAFTGFRTSRLTRHLVIDEMQDYTPIQYAVINRIFPCQKTILGDFGQFINPNHLHTLADMTQLYHDAELVELTKSYRSTYEIITFSKSILAVDKLEPMERHGEIPLVIPCKNKMDEVTIIRKRLDAFLEGQNVSLGIILKTSRLARELYDLLVKDYDIRLISPDSTQFTNGISVTSIQMSKGLEFDEVIIPDVNADTYRSEYDRSLLYIASTRAMHRLTLLHTGKRSDFLP